MGRGTFRPGQPRQYSGAVRTFLTRTGGNRNWLTALDDHPALLERRKYNDVSQSAGSAQASDASRDSGVTQPAGSEAAANVSEQLFQGVIDKVMGDVTEIVARAHYKLWHGRISYEPLPRFAPALDKARKEEMRFIKETYN